jgi:uncharacterized C2H2 Zn-finger protein
MASDVTIERHRMLMWWWIQVLKEYGDKARHVSKAHLYEEAGKRVFYAQDTAGKLIRKLSKDKAFMAQVSEIEDLYEDI